MSPDGSVWEFKYDRDGLRTERVYSYGGEVIVKNEYTWVDGQLTKEYRSGGMISTPITLEYYYDGEELIGFNYNGDDYYYGKTNNGEIRFIYDSNGNIVTTYHYDAWGNPIPTDESSDSEVGRIIYSRFLRCIMEIIYDYTQHTIGETIGLMVLIIPVLSALLGLCIKYVYWIVCQSETTYRRN